VRPSAFAVRSEPRRKRGAAPADLDAAFKSVADARPSAFFTLGGGLFLDNHRCIVRFATKHRLPGVFPGQLFVEAGALMSYGPNLPRLFHRAAAFVDRILKGAKPGDLPIDSRQSSTSSSTSRRRTGTEAMSVPRSVR